MDKWQFRTLMLQGKRVWLHGSRDGAVYNKFGYIWSVNHGHDNVWVGKTWGKEEPEQAKYAPANVQVVMENHFLPLVDVYAMIDKLGGFA